MEAIWYECIDDFVKDTWDVLMIHEVQNNLLMGNAKRELDGGKPNDLRVVVADEKVHLIGIMTAPFNLVLYEVNNVPCEAALIVLVDELIKKEIEIPGVIGEATLVRRFNDYYISHTHKRCRLKLGLNLMVLEQVGEPKPAPGKMRLATEEDLYFLPYWQDAFAEEALSEHVAIEESVQSLKRNIANQRIWIWEDQHPVTCVMASRPLENAIGIGFVYTPPMYRGKGYAQNCVARVSQELLASGYKQCYLFADQKNPISNGIYQKIGYEDHGVFEEIMFEDRGACQVKTIK